VITLYYLVEWSSTTSKEITNELFIYMYSQCFGAGARVRAALFFLLEPEPGPHQPMEIGAASNSGDFLMF
jgi:hypothetical protein